MAKLNLKKLLLSSCFSVILLLSCEKEFFEEEHSNHESNIKKTKVNFDDFKENQKAFDVYKKLNLTDSKSNNKNSDVQNSSSHDFEINFNSGLHLSYHNLESYTFPIRRDVDNGLLENIVISEHTDGKYYAKLLKYNLTTQERIDLANEELKSIQNPIVTEMLGEYTFGNQIQSEICYETVQVITSCGSGQHHGGNISSWASCQSSQLPSIKTVTVATACDTGGGGGGGTGDGSGGYYGDPFYGGGGSGGGGYITPDFPNDNTPTDLYEDGISEPVLDIGDGTNTFYNTINSDAQNIKDLMGMVKNKADGTETNIKTRIDYLKSQLTIATKENGAMYDKNQNPIYPTGTFGNTGPNSTNFYNAPKSHYIILHMHQNTYTPIGTSTPKTSPVAPSDIDVFNFTKLLDYTDNKNATSILVNRIGTYAIRVNDVNKVINTFNTLENNIEAAKSFIKEYDRLVMTPHEAVPLDDSAVMNGFITFVNTHLVNGQSMGLSFYQAVYDNQDNITNWVKL